MYILKNALQNLLRNRGRNLMIAGIIFVIIVSSVAALMINNTADGVIDDYKTRFGSEVTISPNMQKLQAQAQKNEDGSSSTRVPSIPAEQLIDFGKSEQLQQSIYTAQAKGNSDDLKAIDEEKGGGGGPSVSTSMNGVVKDEQLGRQFYFKLLANKYDDFTNGLRELTDGSRMPETDGECIISTELLENSGLSIGDTITVDSALDDGGVPEEAEYTDISYTLTIVGTYYDATDEYSTGMSENAYNNRRNEIFATFDTIVVQMVDGLNGIDVEATYYLKNPDLLDAFTAELRDKGLDDVFDVTTDESSYQKIIGPVEGLKSITLTFAIIVLAFGAIIIALLSSIAIRERKYEIGVLRAMGMKKGKVVLGLWSEMLVITALCLVIGLGVGTMVAQPLTNVMLEQQVAAAEEANNANNGLPAGASVVTVGGDTKSDAQPLENMDVSLEMTTLLEIIAIALLLSSLAALIGTQKIVKYEPIKILMERN